MNAKRILLVNGDEHSRHAYRVLLENTGFSVREAGNGVEALSDVHRNFPDLIVQELKLAALGGLDLVRSIKQAQATRHILVLVITAYALDEDKAVAAGCDAFLRKPCRPSTMLEAAQRLLARAPDVVDPTGIPAVPQP
jgi:two-component system, cell cycle response regulator DivK